VDVSSVRESEETTEQPANPEEPVYIHSDTFTNSDEDSLVGQFTLAEPDI
jgi:hypothetical protein